MQTGRVIDSHFLHLYLHLVHLSGRTEKLQRRTTGIRNLDFGEYQKVPVPLPSPPIQRAVAHVLLTVQEAKEARQRELVLERERKAALMEYLFTRGTRSEDEFEPERTLPRGWNLIQAGELIADGPQNGLSALRFLRVRYTNSENQRFRQRGATHFFRTQPSAPNRPRDKPLSTKRKRHSHQSSEQLVASW